MPKPTQERKNRALGALDVIAETTTILERAFPTNSHRYQGIVRIISETRFLREFVKDVDPQQCEDTTRPTWREKRDAKIALTYVREVLAATFKRIEKSGGDGSGSLVGQLTNLNLDYLCKFIAGIVCQKGD